MSGKSFSPRNKVLPSLYSCSPRNVLILGFFPEQNSPRLPPPPSSSRAYRPGSQRTTNAPSAAPRAPSMQPPPKPRSAHCSHPLRNACTPRSPPRWIRRPSQQTSRAWCTTPASRSRSQRAPPRPLVLRAGHGCADAACFPTVVEEGSGEGTVCAGW
ncbi:hypothetical protein B0H14DRAFT_1185355 [Mycena olivaceomarginata]|nr:hypothetical protein B0H14DRAFT_1185355 [Mycena olivaceomarginata]